MDKEALLKEFLDDGCFPDVNDLEVGDEDLNGYTDGLRRYFDNLENDHERELYLWLYGYSKCPRWIENYRVDFTELCIDCKLFVFKHREYQSILFYIRVAQRQQLEDEEDEEDSLDFGEEDEDEDGYGDKQTTYF